jgi:hypothetical protein
MNTSGQFTKKISRIAGALMVSLLAVSPVAAAGAPGVQIAQPKAASTATPEATVVPASGPVVENPWTALYATVRAFSRVKSYRATQVVTSTAQGYETVGQTTIEYVAPGTLHMLNLINGKADEHIVVGNTLYVKTADGWQKSQLMVTTLIKSMDFAGVVRLINYAPNYVTKSVYIGPDVVNEVPTQVYQYQMCVSPLPINATLKMWIGADHLPYRADTTLIATYNGKTITNTASALISDYNTPITITVPITITH